MGKGDVSYEGEPRPQPVLWHVPVGALERPFDFGARGEPHERDWRIASAVNLVNTLQPRRVGGARHRVRVHPDRIVHGDRRRGPPRLPARRPRAAPLLGLPWVGALAQSESGCCRRDRRCTSARRVRTSSSCEMEDAVRKRLGRPSTGAWRGRTSTTSRLRPSAIAERVAEGDLSGWCTPGRSATVR